jgi:hypothetical protein
MPGFLISEGYMDTVNNEFGGVGYASRFGRYSNVYIFPNPAIFIL